MFDLEQAIANWREQMLAAGIKTPVPLEELEIHLREEIDRQIKSGMNAGQAFQHAVQEIGCARELQNEFSKVEGKRKMVRVLALIAGWMAAGWLLSLCIVFLDMDWNFFNFSPKWSWSVVAEMLGIVLTLTALWFLARASRDKASRIVSLIICVLVMYDVVNTFTAESIGVSALVSESGTHETVVTVVYENGNKQTMSEAEARAYYQNLLSQAFTRHEPSPLWFRAGNSLLLCLPTVFWIWWSFRRFQEKRKTTHENFSMRLG